MHQRKVSMAKLRVNFPTIYHILPLWDSSPLLLRTWLIIYPMKGSCHAEILQYSKLHISTFFPHSMTNQMGNVLPFSSCKVKKQRKGNGTSYSSNSFHLIPFLNLQNFHPCSKANTSGCNLLLPHLPPLSNTVQSEATSFAYAACC